MGRNTTTPLPQSLDRFSVGEIVDIAGVPDLYNAGTSTWAKTNVFLAASSFPESTKNNIANTSNAPDQIVLTNTLNRTISNAGKPASVQPIARITASNISCFPNGVPGANSTVTTITSSGPQIVTTGLTNWVTSDQGIVQHLVVSDGTTLFHYGFTATGTLALYTSTDGLTWTSQAMTGNPAITINAVTAPFFSGAVRNPAGDSYGGNASSSYGVWGVVWCGARFLLFGPSLATGGGGVMLAATSTNGYTWTSNAAGILGSTSLAGAVNVHFERNGNNCWFKMGGGGHAKRYSTDGGITWANTTSNVSARYSNFDAGLYVYRNTTDPAKFIFHDTTNATLSTDSGANFTTDFAFPYSGFSAMAYKGNTIIVSGSATASHTLRISTNNGASFSAVLLPVGTLNNWGNVFADANRFYFLPISTNQILTSVDGVTWTIVQLNVDVNDQASSGSGIIAFDANNVCIVGSYSVAITSDGGVTWKVMKTQTSGANSVYVGNGYFTPDGGGYAILGNGNNTANYNGIVSKASLTEGGSFYKIGTSAIAALRTNANAYVRIA